MTKAAQIKELAKRIVSCADAMAEPKADVQAEAASIDRYMVRIKALTTDAQITVCHERPALIDQQTCRPVIVPTPRSEQFKSAG
jgi:hypothetical protein